MLDTFQSLYEVHFMYTICFFKSREFSSPTLQTVHKLELKRRSYGCLKTTASSCAKFRSPKPISQLRNKLRNPPLAHECHFAAHVSIFAAANHIEKSPLSCEWSCKSSPSCGITSKLWNHKFNLQNQSSNLENEQFNMRNPPMQSQIFATD